MSRLRSEASTPSRRAMVGNLIAFYAGWLACVTGAARGGGAAGPALAAVIVAAHIALSDDRGRTLRFVLLCLLIGVVVDGGIAAAGLVRYAAADLPAPLPPTWILGLWALFATTFDLSLRWLDSRPLLASALGLFAGPASYLTGQRLGALELASRLDHLVVLGIIWAAVLLLLTRLSDRAHRPVPPPPAPIDLVGERRTCGVTNE